MNLPTLFDQAKSLKASDIHLASGETPRVRVAGDLVKLDLPPFETQSLSSFLSPILPADYQTRIDSGQPVEQTIVHDGLAFCGVVFRVGNGGLAATFRILAKDVPSLADIGEGAMPLMESFVEARRGLILITGPTGSGKWTTASAVVDAINQRKPARIFVVELHPSYVFESKESLVTQLHVGQDFESYAQALETAHQADPDVIAVENIPTGEALRQILMLVETGHLVIANLHAESVSDALLRLFESAEGSPEALGHVLARNLVAITAQRLLPRIDRAGRVPAYSWVVASSQLNLALQSGDIEQVRQIQDSDPKSRSFEAALEELVQSGKITPETAAAQQL